METFPQRSGQATFVRRRAVVLLAAAAVAGPWMGPVREALSEPTPVAVSSTSYLVRSGDSLWGIAERLSPGEDPRPLVDAIAEANGIAAGDLQVGQTLLIPAR